MAETRAMRNMIRSWLLVICLVPVLAVLAPKAIAFVIPVSGLLLFIFAERIKGDFLSFDGSLSLILGGLILLLFASITWSLDGAGSFEKAFKTMWVIIGGGLFLRASLYIAQFLLPSQILHALLWALFGSCLFVAAETMLDFGIYRVLHPDHDGFIMAFSKAAYNKSAVVFSILVWPVLYLLSVRKIAHWKMDIFLVWVAVFVTVLITESDAALLVMIIAPIIWTVGMILPKKIFIGFAACILFSGVLAMPYLVHFAFFKMFDLFVWWDAACADSRLAIWAFFAEKIQNQPLYGYGLGTVHLFSINAPFDEYLGGDSVTHTHNGFIQIWTELGIIGVAVMLTLFSLLFVRMGALSGYKLSFSMAMLATIVLLAMVTYSLWAGWWLATFFWIASLTVAVLEIPSKATVR